MNNSNDEKMIKLSEWGLEDKSIEAIETFKKEICELYDNKMFYGISLKQITSSTEDTATYSTGCCSPLSYTRTTSLTELTESEIN